MSAADLGIQPRINSESLSQAFEQSLVAENDFSMDAAPHEAASMPVGVVLHPLLFDCPICSWPGQAVFLKVAPQRSSSDWPKAVENAVIAEFCPRMQGTRGGQL